MRKTRALFALPVLAVGLVGCGDDTDTDASTSEARVVEVGMADNAFDPATLQVGSGLPITFRFTNTDDVRHEALIGDEAAQEEHHQEMTASTADGHGGATTEGDHGGTSAGMAAHGEAEAEGDAVTVDPGETAELTYTFEERGTFIIGCHEPGHWEAGMKVEVDVR
jgi:uncharacterized cupredoxin-like copper-binding protein